MSPRSMRWDLITHFEVLKKGVYSRAVKSYSGAEDFFKENFPVAPRVPETFFIEMIAQVGGVLFGLGLDFKKEIILAKIEDVSFYCEVPPPCVLTIEARIADEREDGAWIHGFVNWKNEKVMEAKVLLAAVNTLAEGKNPIVFNDHFMKSYDILEVARKSEALGSVAP